MRTKTPYPLGTGKLCTDCGKPTPYTDWTICEACMAKMVAARIKQKAEQAAVREAKILVPA